MRRSASIISLATPKKIGPVKRSTSTPGGSRSLCSGSSSGSTGTSPACSLIRRMNSKAASVTPTPIATVMSTRMVSRKVRISSARSPGSLRSRRPETACLAHAPGHHQQHAPKASPSARRRSGPRPAAGRASRNRACSIPASGVCAPARTLVAVRAMAPVAGRPPKAAEAILATPIPTSSCPERWR